MNQPNNIYNNMNPMTFPQPPQNQIPPQYQAQNYPSNTNIPNSGSKMYNPYR